MYEDAVQPVRDVAELTPTITCDVRLGQFVSGLELEPGYFARLMAERIGDVEVNEIHGIHLSADCEVEDSPDGPIVGWGHYDPTKKVITTNVGTIKYVLDYVQAEPDGEPFTLDELDAYGSKRATENAIHETSHAIDYKVLGSAALLDELVQYLDEQTRVPFRIRALRASRNPRRVEIGNLLRSVALREMALKLDHGEYIWVKLNKQV